ncbi:MAG: Na+/H+ antiporter NhaA [bacterium]|nr:Na+/H+ antiporter NhaA [bacterium]
MKRALNFMFSNSLFLIFGAAAGLVWANLDKVGYGHLLHLKLLANPILGVALPEGGYAIDVHYLVNEILMAFFFAIAGKEVWEATLPGGSLNDPRRAATPLISAIGGMAGPALLYLAGAYLVGQGAELGKGWAIPCATDIAFGYMVVLLVFGPTHPAVPFLLLLAIADDAMGLMILAIFYPQGEVVLAWMLLPVGAVGIGLLFRRLGLSSAWWYMLIPGALSWFGFAKSGLHPALGLLPVIPILPHAHVAGKAFEWAKLGVEDTLNRFEHGMKKPVEIILGLFGLLNAGVVFSAVGAPTYLVLVGLLVGKPLGIWLFGMISGKTFGFGMPEGIGSKELFVVGCAAGIGFTVALFVATVAFPAGPIQDAAKMGALASFAAAILTVVAARVMGVKKWEGEAAKATH